MNHQPQLTNLIDNFGRHINYARISVTDRCNFRCVYCMVEEMNFLPRDQVLSFEEITHIVKALLALGVENIRITGGEPLIRRGILQLFNKLGRLSGLRELLVTTNGSQLSTMAAGLRKSGVKRINISLDTLIPERFKTITRIGRLDKVLSGIDAAIAEGFEGIKLNCVIMKGYNFDEVISLVNFARDKGIDIAFIEEMPLGMMHHNRQLSYCSSDEIRTTIESVYPLIALSTVTAGPAKYYAMVDSDIKIGLISPHSHNFCSQCNRIRVTVEGRLLLCLGNEHSVDLRPVIRNHPDDLALLKETIQSAMSRKPERHYFDLSAKPQILRFMNATGG